MKLEHLQYHRSRSGNSSSTSRKLKKHTNSSFIHDLNKSPLQEGRARERQSGASNPKEEEEKIKPDTRWVRSVNFDEKCF